jgi:xanthine dehydrogenase accessory factor
MDPIINAACELLEQGQGFVLATIVRQQGSAPRTTGTRMLITAGQKIIGTIGGGQLEAGVIRAAAKMNEQTPGRLISFDLSNQDAAKMAMVCGGLAQVLLDYIQPGEENQVLFNKWRESLEQGLQAALISIVYGREKQIEHIDHLIYDSDEHVKDQPKLSAALQKKLSGLLIKTAHVQVFDHEQGLVVVDPGQMGTPLYIFGAGHVAQPTAHLAAMTGFSVVVIDDREEFANAERFPEAMAIHTLPDFENAFDCLAVNTDAFIIIVTRGHLHDRTVLAQALKTQAAYIGMIGSRSKRDAVYSSLLKDGFTAGDLDRVHCPIGLAIGADSPEEIAVSIVAEMIAARAGVHP